VAPVGGTAVQDHVALAEIELCGELIIAASAAEPRLPHPEEPRQTQAMSPAATTVPPALPCCRSAIACLPQAVVRQGPPLVTVNDG
jgi:hypothetical protein